MEKVSLATLFDVKMNISVTIPLQSMLCIDDLPVGAYPFALPETLQFSGLQRK
jgi:hypothetical protein